MTGPVSFSTTVAQYAKEHHMTEEQAIQILGLANNVNRYQIFTFEEIPEGGYKTVTSKTDTFRHSQRVQDLETPETKAEEIIKTKYLNDKRKDFKNGNLWNKFLIGAEIFITHPTDFIPFMFE